MSGGLLLLLSFAILLGVFASIAFAWHVHAEYYPKWGGASWIKPRKPAANAYYRKQLFLSSAPANAHLQIAGPDIVYLYVNGTSLGSQVLVSALPSSVTDIGPYLVAGKNVIAIKVERKTGPGTAQLAVNGSWQDRAGVVHEFGTDNSWRVSTKEELQLINSPLGLINSINSTSGQTGSSGQTVQNQLYWYMTNFKDVSWDFAVAQDSLQDDGPMQYLDVPPSLFRDFPRGQWIWNETRAVEKATFRREFQLPEDIIREAWIGISSSTAAYALAINGMTVVPDAPSPYSYMDTYDIAMYLRPGKNTVTLDMVAIVPASLAAISLIVDAGGRQFDFSSDRQWLSRNTSPAAPQWAPAAVVGAMDNLPLITELQANAAVSFGYPTVRVLQVSAPRAWWVKKVVNCAGWIIGILLVTLMLTWLAYRVFDPDRPGNALLWQHLAYPCAVGSIVLCFLFFLQFDVRMTKTEVFQPLIALLLWGLTLLWTGTRIMRTSTRRRPPGQAVENAND